MPARAAAIGLGVGLLLSSGRAAAFDETEARAALEVGDHGWFWGQRRRGARSWRRALRQARGGTSPAEVGVAIQARVRLLRAGTSISAVARTVSIARAAERCPVDAPACQLAFADLALLGRGPWSEPKAQTRRRIESFDSSYPAEAVARRALLGEPSSWEVFSPGRDDRPGIYGLIDHAPVAPPPAELALGVLADPGLGIGAGVHLQTYDAFRRRVRVRLDAAVARHGGGGALSFGASRGGLRVDGAAYGLRTRWLDGATGTYAPLAWGGAEVVVAGRVRSLATTRSLWLGAGPELRFDVDAPGSPALVGPGLVGRAVGHVRVDERGSIDGLVDARWTPGFLADYDRVGGLVELVAREPIGRVHLAQRARVELARGLAQPAAREPMLGGPWALRSAPPGALRGAAVGLVDVEAQVALAPWIALAGFGELGLTRDQAHPGGGLGVRLRAGDPAAEPLRVDVGAGRLGVQVQIGWGEPLGPVTRAGSRRYQ